MEWAGLFPGRFYLELQRAGAPHAESYVEAAVRLAGSSSLPVVATHPVQFLNPADFTAHEARVCIAEGQVLGDQRRPRPFTPQSYFLSQAEMAKLFADLPEALANSVEIARRCNLALELGSQGCRFSRRRRACRARNIFISKPRMGWSCGSLRITGAGRTRSGRKSTSFASKSSCEPSSRWDSPATSSSSPTSSTGRNRTAYRSARDAARAPGRSSPTRSASPTWTPCATTSCSSAS